VQKRLQSPTARLIAGLAVTLGIVAAFCSYTLYQIAGLRQMQNETIERDRKDSLQLLRIQNDLSALGLAMRDMVTGDEPYPLYAWSAQFERIHKDMDDAIRLDAQLSPLANGAERQQPLERGLAQFWISVGQMFHLARDAQEARARDLLRTSLEAQQTSLVSAVSRLLVENSETQQRTAARVGAIYERVAGQIYWLFAAALICITATSLMLIQANRTVFHAIRALSDRRSALARKLITVQEEMFRSISRELHDEFGQMLTAIGTMLSRARRMHCPPELTADLDEIRAAAQLALDKTRSLTQTLHPSILDDAGLEETVDWYLSVFEKQTGIHVALEKSGASQELGGDRLIHVYRVLQESLNNLSKHSQSLSAWVRLRFSRDWLELEVEDRGIGLQPEDQQGGRRGMGMIGMRERAELLSGRIEFLTPDGGGTLVRLIVPLAPPGAISSTA
jgi:signal transduction histidine kinase